MSPRDIQRRTTGGVTLHTAAVWRIEVISSGRLITRTLAGVERGDGESAVGARRSTPLTLEARCIGPRGARGGDRVGLGAAIGPGDELVGLPSLQLRGHCANSVGRADDHCTGEHRRRAGAVDRKLEPSWRGLEAQNDSLRVQSHGFGVLQASRISGCQLELQVRRILMIRSSE